MRRSRWGGLGSPSRWPSARAIRAACAGALVAASVAAAPAQAQFWRHRELPSGPPPGVTPLPLQEVRIEEQLGAGVPLDEPFTDWRGRPFTFRQAFDGHRPVVVALVYYDCPMLCGLVLNGMARALRENGLALGKDFQAVTLSFDPAESAGLAAERRRGHLQAVGLPDASEEWPFLVGPATSSKRVADALGFHYSYDQASGEWAHMAAIFVLTPDGKVSRYLYGIDYAPKDLRLALVEAGGGRVGTSFDRVLLTCYRYDPASRKYVPYAFGLVRLGGGLTLLILAAVVGRLFWRERARARQDHDAASPPRPPARQVP